MPRQINRIQFFDVEGSKLNLQIKINEFLMTLEYPDDLKEVRIIESAYNWSAIVIYKQSIEVKRDENDRIVLDKNHRVVLDYDSVRDEKVIN